MYAKITLQVPDDKAEMIRQVAAYQRGESMTIRDFLDMHLVFLAANFGPECTADVTESGMGDPPS